MSQTKLRAGGNTGKGRRGEKPLCPLSQDMEVTAEELEYVLNAVLSKSECSPLLPPVWVRAPRLLLRATGCCSAVIRHVGMTQCLISKCVPP